MSPGRGFLLELGTPYTTVCVMVLRLLNGKYVSRNTIHHPYVPVINIIIQMCRDINTPYVVKSPPPNHPRLTPLPVLFVTLPGGQPVCALPGKKV